MSEDEVGCCKVANLIIFDRDPNPGRAVDPRVALDCQ